MPQHLRTNIDLSPAQELQAFFLCDGLEHLLRTVFRKLILREEEHADAVLSLSADTDPEFRADFPEELVRNLGQNTDTVSCLPLRVLPGAVLQVLDNCQSMIHGLMALFPLDVYTAADSAGIMLKACVVQRRLRQVFPYVKHADPPCDDAGMPHMGYLQQKRRKEAIDERFFATFSVLYTNYF